MISPDKIKLPEAFWIGVDRLSIKRSHLLTTASLPLSLIMKSSSVTTQQFFELWRALEVIAGANVGQALIANIDRTILPPSFLVAYYARNFEDALQRVARFKSLCASEKITLSFNGDYVSVTAQWPFSREKPPQPLADATLLSIIQLGMYGTKKPSLNVKLKLCGPVRDFKIEGLEHPIKWHASENELLIHKDELKSVFVHFNDELTALLDVALENELEKQQAELSYKARVEWILRRMMTAGRPSIGLVAKELAVSQRSLQRKLSSEGASFQIILSDTRHQLAIEYLRKSNYDLIEIAFMLGYEDQASFFRAFQGWENVSPAKWRKSNLRNKATSSSEF